VSTGSLKKVPKTASIECCARPPVLHVMKVCFILVLGHRYETCTLVFYRGVVKKATTAQSAPMPHCSPFYRGCFEGVTCAPRINLISIKWWGTNADLNSQGDKLTRNNYSEVKSAKKGGLRLPASPGGISDSNSV